MVLSGVILDEAACIWVHGLEPLGDELSCASGIKDMLGEGRNPAIICRYTQGAVAVLQHVRQFLVAHGADHPLLDVGSDRCWRHDRGPFSHIGRNDLEVMFLVGVQGTQWDPGGGLKDVRATHLQNKEKRIYK